MPLDRREALESRLNDWLNRLVSTDLLLENEEDLLLITRLCCGEFEGLDM